MKKVTITTALFMFSTLFVNLFAHCEIPCGIYGDEARVALIAEHCETIEKSMKKIVTLSAEEKIDQNQLVRWVNNKEEHCKEIQEIVTQYFMTQRIKVLKEDDPKYKENMKKLGLLHKMLVYAMKCKQSTDVKNVEKLEKTLEKFSKAYFDKK